MPTTVLNIVMQLCVVYAAHMGARERRGPSIFWAGAVIWTVKSSCSDP